MWISCSTWDFQKWCLEDRDVDSILKALYKLFDESPAKREDYSAITGSNKFPLPFCGNRWVEDKKVAERALQIWPDVMVYIKETVKKPKGEVPVSYSFTTIRSAVQDCLTTAKLEFFVSTASIMEPFLLMPYSCLSLCLS